MIPVMDHRTPIGHARTPKGAERIIRRTVDIPPRARLQVWQRPAHLCDILGMPPAWVYSVSWGHA